MDVNVHQLSMLAAGVYLAFAASQPDTALAAYQEAGRPGDADSWRSAEYLQDWGLERMQASQAYAAGFTGNGVKIGALDSGFDATHPEASSLRYHPVIASGRYPDGSAFEVSGGLNAGNDTHGTHVTGTLGAARDGNGMHGVAFNAQVYVGNTNGNDGMLFGPSPDLRYFQAVYGALADAGVRVINNSWGSQPKDVSYQTLDGLHAAYAQHFGQGTWLDAAAQVSRRGVINVFSAGNSGYANASVRSALPYFQPELEGHWLAVSGLDKNNQQKYNQCGIAKYWCLATPGAAITSTVPGGGYATYNGTSMAAPHATGALALVMERYPYLDNQQALQVLLTTARQLDGSLTQAPGSRVGWGVPDLGRALHGPGQLLGEFRVNLGAGQGDVWSNGISDQALAQRQVEDAAEHQAWQQTLRERGWEQGPGAQASQQELSDYAVGMARDAAAAQRLYQGSLVKSGGGWLLLSGDSSYRGPTRVEGGLLVVDGSLASAVTVNSGASLGGSGQIAALTANRGARVAPGNSIGTLTVAGDVTFQPGSNYVVELSPTASDRIVAGGRAHLQGAELSLTLEHSAGLLSAGQVQGLLGRSFDILQAAGGIDGQFALVQPNYLFLGAVVDYSAGAVQLDLVRSAATFASVAASPNQRAVAEAVEQLGAADPVYESLLLSTSEASAQGALQQLSGEIYPALEQTLLHQGRDLREAFGQRLQRSGPRAGEGAASFWIRGLGGQSRTDGDSDHRSYQSSGGGVLLGLDHDLDADTRLGLAAGYSDSSLRMGGASHSSAQVDSYHLGAYAGHDLGDLRLSLGASHSWHSAQVRRDLQYAAVSAKQKARVTGRSSQLFSEAAYRLPLPALTLEPFANLAYVYLQRDAFHEKGDAAALRAGDDSAEALLGTLGARGLKRLDLSSGQPLQLSSRLAWQQRLSHEASSQHLGFASGGPSFAVDSAKLSRGSALLGFEARLGVTAELDLSLDYQGQLGDAEQFHSVGLNLDWRF
ncbi:autotransporter serine peptidase EprS [Pseudomonas sp. Au-Pse12]|uniref:autotransporter serine peptidase EprS n=1 Tax=Pseudomonas sp. Au-Pse12 TaxID=2906459 RepID=UPI001E37118A|nr:autotransporter serine protease [Pseudomonas sp. Au-Pse12]MCE4052982.1 autotransporter domain-containing protein [Pseudomonas sp. Au-Pse12]